MKIKFQCSKCFLTGFDTHDSVQVQDEDLYLYECSKGHKNLYFLKNEKFELLMESAMYAIIDGYYREAVTSMTSSLERLQEFTTKIIFNKYNSSEVLLNSTWKNVSQQSERQLGAFIFLYSKEFRELPDTLSNNDRKFRNDVIHKGKFPSYEETIKYGQRVLNISYNTLKILRGSLEHIISNISDKKQKKMMDKFHELGESPFTHLSNTSINLHHSISSFEKTNLIDYIELLKKEYH